MPTDGSGAYSFGNLLPGSYTVDVTNPCGTVTSAAALLESNPRPSDAEIDVSGLPVRVAADESAHTDQDALRRIELGYGAIALKDRSDRREHNDNYLWTKQPYGDFVLDLEFKVTQGTNSGIFLRA